MTSTAHGLFALPLLIALALSSLVVVVAAPQPVAAAGTYFTEGFGSGFGPNLTSITGTPSVGGGAVTMPSSNNNVVRTADSDYQTDSFCAEVTVVDYVGGGDNRAYLGFGPGLLAGSDGDFPQQGPAVVLRSLGQFGGNFADNLTLLTSPTLGGTGTEDLNLGAQGLGTGPYTLQLGYDVFAEEVRVSVDGRQFGQTVDVSGYDFTGNGRVFFAGQGVTFDDFSMQAGPCAVTARTFTVDTAADILTAPTIDGVCDDGSGNCRLREAILEANAFGGIDTIAFDIPGAGAHTLTSLANWPAITDSVIIDGYTQPGATPNTLVDGNNANLLLELSGAGVGGNPALDLTATDQSVVRGLAINQFNGGGATAIAAGPGTVIEGNFIGTDVTGTKELPNWDGIVVSDAGGVTIGGPDPAQRNLISGNAQSGVTILGDSDEVTVQGNFIGTDASGNAAIPNFFGVRVEGDDDFSLSNVDVVNFLSISDNTISGNSFEGVSFWGAAIGTRVVGNKIGVGADGVTPVGNNPSPGPDVSGFGGVVIRNWVRDTQVGGDGLGEGNLIGYNSNGVNVFSGINNRIVGNEFVDNTRLGVSLPLAGTNDPGDVDSPRGVSYFSHPSGNYGQNSPGLTRVGIAPNGDLGVEYSIDSLVAESAYPISIDFYVADTSSSGEGRTLIGTASAAAPGPGTFNIGDAGVLGVAPGEAIVAMATDAEGNSSPFSAVAFVDDVEKVTVGSDGDRVGQAVAIDGNRMAVSAPNADVGATDAGVVYVYDRADDASPWALTATIASPSPEVEGRFGDAVDLRGNLLAVGESDRLGDSAEPGRVWVFELDAGTWSVVGGGFFTAFPVSDGDHFGASLAWIDDERLAVGAPGENSDTGQVSIARLNPGEDPFWSVTDLSTTFSTATLDAGDQLGYAVAFDDSPAGDGRLVAGAPGASRRYFWNIPLIGTTVGNPGVAQFDAAWNMGSAIDISGDRIVMAGFSDELRVNVNEANPIQRSNTTSLGAVLPPDSVGGVINDYVDIEGTTVAVSRGGDGGQVELYRLADDSISLSNPTTYDPGSAPGDLLGFAIDLQGRTLVAGAPSANSDAGAVFTDDVGVSATYTGPFNGDPLDPANWDLGVVPGPGDTAIIGDGTTVLSGGDWTIGRLELRDANTRLEMQSSTLTLDGVAGDDRPSVIGLRTFLNIDSQPVGAPFGPARLELVGSDLLVEGAGDDISRGRLSGNTATFAINAGRTIQVSGEISQGGFGSSLEIEIAGSGDSTDNFGRIELLDGVRRADFSVADLQIVDSTGPTGLSGEYAVLTCDTCTETSNVFQPPFAQGTAGLTAVRVGKGLTLFTGDPAFTATWIGESADPFFNRGDNWDTGIAPGVNDTAVIPPGFTDVEVFNDVGEVGRLELDDSTISLTTPNRELRLGSTELLNNGEIFVGPGAILELSNDVLLDGFIQVTDSGSEGVLVLDGDVAITGDGELTVLGELRKTGGGRATIDVGDFPTPNAGVFTGPLTNTTVSDGVLEFTGADLADGQLQGSTVVASGAQLAVDGDLVVEAPSSIAVAIDGDASTTDNYGQFVVSGTFTKGGELVVNQTVSLAPTDVYDVVLCGDCTPGTFDVEPAGLTTQISANAVSVSASPCNTTFNGSGGDSLWANPSNWSSGVPTASSVACFDGGDVVIATGTDAEALRLDGDVPFTAIEGSLTLTEDSEFTNGFRLESTGSLNGTGEITVGSGPGPNTGTTMNVSGLVTAPLRVTSDTFLDIRAGATFRGAQIINDGQVAVYSAPFAIEDGTSIINNGFWIFLDDLFDAVEPPFTQTVTSSGAPSTLLNQGEIRVNAGVTAALPVGVALDFADTSNLELDIVGTSASGNFGRLEVDGSSLTLGANTVLQARNDFGVLAPTIFDRYDVLDCGAVDCPLFPVTNFEPGVEQFLVGGDLVLGLATAQNTFVNTAPGVSWTADANWSDGVVPGPGDVAVVPAGATPTIAVDDVVEVDRLVLDGELALDGTLSLDTATVGPTAILRIRNQGTMSASADVEVQDGGQVVIFESTDDGVLALGDGASVIGDGLVANSGVLRTNGSVAISDGVTWNSGVDSLVDVQSGALDVSTTNFDTRGGLAAAPGSTLTLPGDTILRPSSVIRIGLASDGTSGEIVTDRLAFDPFADGDGDTTFARFELDLVDGSAPQGPISVIRCTDCSADPFGSPNAVEFDEFVTGDYDVLVGRDTVDVAVLDNKYRSAAGGFGYGSSVSVDDDRAVVGSADGVTGPAVLERSFGVWSVVQQLTDGSSVDVALDGDQFIADGILYAVNSDSGEFETAFGPTPAVPGGTVADLDGAFGIVGDAAAGTAQVFARTDFQNPLATLSSGPLAVPSSYATDVAVVDLGSGNALAVVSAPVEGAVYVFQRAEGAWSTSPIRTLTSPDGDGNDFGRSIAISDTALVVGEPLNDGPRDNGGAAWVYPINGFSLADSPIKLTPSEIDGGDLFGSSVAIDGSVIVVGAEAAQKFNFPVRDGAAFVFQDDGTDWVETDEIRPPDPFSFELFGAAVAVSGTDVFVGTPRDRNSNGFRAGAVYDLQVEALVVEPPVMLDLTLASSAGGALPVAASVAISDLDRLAAEGENAGSTLAAASLDDVAGDDPTATTLSQIAIGALPLTSIVIDSDVLSAIPLASIEVDGGWGPIIAGSELENEPFASLTFGQVLSAAGAGTPEEPSSSSPAGRIAVLPLTSIDVDGTPLTSIPLTSIALGETPLTSIGGNDFPWCAEYLVGLFPSEADCQGALADLTLLELSLRGVPLTSIPLTSIPLTSIELTDSPLTSIPLTSIDLSQSPLTSIPLTSIDLAGIPLTSIDPASVPLTSIPLTSIPLTSIPVTALPLASIPLTSIPLTSIDPASAPLTSIPLTSIPLTSIGVDGAPLTSIGLQGAPLTSIPLTSILLADTPLTSIPLTSIAADNDAAWCQVLADADVGFDCDSGANPASTTLQELFVRGVPLTSIPLTSIPLTSIDLAGAPLTSIPLTSIPLTSIPLTSIDPAAVPLTSIGPDGTPLTSIPLTSIPLTSINLAGTPLTSIPLTSIPLTSIDPAAVPLTSIPLTSIPLTSIPLTSIGLAGVPLTSIGISDTPLTSIPLTSISASIFNCSLVDCARDTLGDAATAGAIFASATLSDVQEAAGNIRLGEIVDELPGTTSEDIVADFAAAGSTLADLTDLDGILLGDLPLAVIAALGLELGDLGAALALVTYGDLLEALIDPSTGLPFESLDADFRAAIAAQGATVLGDLETLGDVTFGEFLDGLTEPLTLAAIEPILGFITVQSLLDALIIDATDIDFGDADLGALLPDLLGAMTLGDILAEAGGTELGDLLAGIDDELANYTLGDLLLALIDPSSLALGGVDFADVSVSALPEGTSPATMFEARFTVTGSDAETVDVRVELPAGASYLPGTAKVVVDPDAIGPLVETALEPEIGDNNLTWSVQAQPGVTYAVQFEAVLGLRLGTTSLGSTARVVGADVIAVSSTSVEIAEGSENNDFPLVTDAEEGFVYLTYIASETDNDVYRVDVGENDQLYVELSNLDANLDVALYADVTDDAVGAALVGSDFISPDAPLTAITDPDADGADAEPLDDFRRLDSEDPSLELIEVSNGTGTENETFSTGRLREGTYYIQVYGANGATNVRPAALQLQIAESEQAPVCQPLGTLPTVTPVDEPTIGSADTLILFNESRLEQLYDAQSRADVTEAVDRLVSFLDSDPSINPVAVPVDAYLAVRNAYEDWDTDEFCDPESANAVVAAINSEIIDPVREQLEHVVILGADEQIPMARLLDSTSIANEFDFRNEFDGDLAGVDPNARNAFTSSFWDSRILSDEPYGESDARSLGNRLLYVTDIGLGRVVESPTDIVNALDTFVDFSGNLSIDTAAVLGYDFLVDGSEEVAANLETGLTDAGLPPGVVDVELVDGVDAGGELWDRADATEKLIDAGTNALVSLNAHFDHYRALPAIGDKVPGFNDNLIAEDVAAALGPDALRNSLIFSMGCHSGLSVSDITIAGTNTDWAEVLSQQQATFVGNTGFGYGDTEVVAYSERLMADFARRVTAPLDTDRSASIETSTVGQALAWAKNDYIGGLSNLSVYDEKASMEATFYGLPFYRVGLPASELPPVPDNDPGTDNELDVVVDATNEAQSTPSGTYYSNLDSDGEELVIVAPGRPLQPKTELDVSVVDPSTPEVLATVAHGAVIESMESTYIRNVDPVIAAPIFDESANQPEPAVGDVVFPVRPLDITTSSGPDGERQTLVVATGQFDADGNVQRLDDGHAITVYYSDSEDFTPPTIGAVRTSNEGGVLDVDVPVRDVSGVERVVVLVAQNPGLGNVVWTAEDLEPAGGTDRWATSIDLLPQTVDVEFIVQALDGAGNVAFAAAAGENFGEVTLPSDPDPDPAAGGDLEVTVGGLAGVLPGFFDGDVTVTPTESAAAIQYSVDGGDLVEIESGESFTISGSGPHTYLVITDADEFEFGEFTIDAADPTIEIRTPAADGDVFPASSPVRFDATCLDDTEARCDRTLTAVDEATGDSIPGTSRAVPRASRLPASPGSYRLDVVATDPIGNRVEATRTFRIAPTVGSPVLDELVGPSEPQAIDVPVEITATFGDPSGRSNDYDVTVDWGDGTVETIRLDEADEPTATTPAVVPLSRVYEEAGVYSVSVTVDDDAGSSDSGLFEFVVVFDPDTNGRVSGKGFYWSGPEAHAGSPWFGSPAYFGYNARYRNDAEVPSGRTKLKLVGEFFFRSTAYDYLIVNDSMAIAEGVGTTGGNTSYRFRVQGIDNKWVDFFQITIWDDATGEVLYDNGVIYDDGQLVEEDRGDRVLLGGIRIRS